MPTIDELAPASSASDSDEFIVSQGGIARKITRAQVLTGVQPLISVAPASLLGNFGTASGSPEVIAVGRNLIFSGSTLSATSAPFVIDSLPNGSVPASGDLISISQAGTTVAVTYGQFMNGVAGVTNVNISGALVTSAGSSTGQPLGALIGTLLPFSGGTLTGGLTLSGVPTLPLQAASKSYVDQQAAKALPLTGGSLTGILSLAGLPQQPLDAASKSYADAVGAAMVPLTGASLTGALILSGDPVEPLASTTKRYADLKLSRTGDTLTGALVLAADPVVGSQAATKNYVDVQASYALPKAGGTMGGVLFLASDPTSSAQAATKQYVDQRVLRSGDSLTGPLILAADPTLGSQAATKSYVDLQASSAISKAGGSMSGSLLLAGDPSAALEASTKQYVDLRVSRTGDSLTGALYLASNPTAPMQAATKQYADSQFASAVPISGATLTGPLVLSGDPTLNGQAATKQYVDTKISRSGDTLTGILALASDPTSAAEAATMRYVDAQVLSSLALSGGTLTGALTLAADPVTTGQAATKHYVDTGVAAALPLSGGSLSGALSLFGPPLTAAHAATKQYVDGQISGALPIGGGTLTGPLLLSATPSAPFQAATKSYVDANPNSQGVINVALPPFGAKLDGTTDDTAAFAAAYLAAATGATIYVPSGTTVLRQPGTWGISLTKRVRWVVAGTVLNDGTPLAAAVPTGGGPAAFVLPGFITGNTQAGNTTSQGASQSSDFAVTQSSYIVNHSGGPSNVITNVRSDTIIYNSPGSYVWNGLDRLIWAGTQTPSATAAAQHVGRYIQTLRQAANTDASGSFLPQPQMWGACIEYRDTTGHASSATNASLTIEMDWFGNGADDANSRTIQSLVIGQHNPSGAPVELANIIGVYLAGGSAGSVKTVFGIGVPFSNAVLDTTYAQSINNAPAIKMASGQAIAFESTNSNRLAYDATTNTLRWNQGTLSYAVGKGISVGWVNVVGASWTLPNYISGNLIVLDGSGSYSVGLPAASTVAAGTGFTFTVTGSGQIDIQPNGTDSIDSGPIVLHPNDRYHIVSDGSGSWHEIFWTNAVSPRFLGPMVLANYTVASLPGGVSAGAKAFASNGLKPGEASGRGTGVEVFFDGQHWISSCSGAVVSA